MSDSLVPTQVPVTLAPSFSFYVPATRPDRISAAAAFGDALTVAGPTGPDVVGKLRDSGFTKAALFDGMGYAGTKLPGVEQ